MDGANVTRPLHHPWLNREESESPPTPALAVRETVGKKLARAAPGYWRLRRLSRLSARPPECPDDGEARRWS